MVSDKETETSLKRRTLSSLIWRFLERAGSQVVSLVVQIVLARLLTPADYGMLALIVIFVNVGNVIVQSGLNTALVQAPEADLDDFSTVFWMSLCISLVLYVLVFLCAPAIANYYDMPALVWPLRVITLILIINAYNSIQVAFVARALEFKKLFKATMVAVLVSGTCGIVAAVLGAGVWALVIQQLAAQVTTCFVLAAQVHWHPRPVFKAASARRLFGFGWKLLVSGLMETGYQSLSDLIIGKRFSASDLGLVTQGKRYPNAIGSALDGAIQPVMMSAVSRVQDDLDYVRRLVSRALKTSTFVIFPCMGLLALLARPLVLLLLGEQWLPAVPFLQMYCFYYALLPIHTSNLQALNGVGRSDVFLGLEFIKKGWCFVVLCVTAFVIGDIYAIVGGYLVNGVICTFINAFPNKKVIGYSYAQQLKDMLPAFVLCLVSMALAWPLSLLGLPGIALMLCQTVVMLGVYVCLSRLFKVEAFSYLLDTAKEFLKRRKA